jgi:8-oxo-dGTP diphosphatase
MRGARALTDALYRRFLRLAHPLLRVCLNKLDPGRRGALVALWHADKILVIKNSYLDFYSLPGGHAKKSESSEDAAIRELYEEVGVTANPRALRRRDDLTGDFYGRLSLFELEAEVLPSIRIDNREVVAAEFLTPQQALERELYPPVRALIAERASRD